MKNSINFALVASISAFCAAAGTMDAIVNAITSAKLRIIIISVTTCFTGVEGEEDHSDPPPGSQFSRSTAQLKV
ncbi:hypothetical protein IVA87_27385 [Bradyrhizobium sp. 147]|uniref:hypothetical protein n=1 Tax=unclassified Bradyrhizobium TaxID=2631580 RepID=UPI001FF82DCC|nr:MULTISPECIES: hypothetical protein [unclassified Bradyrhizobium]MCK1683021.1 hypothetical protein [Bradyrhizobium sp. 147]